LQAERRKAMVRLEKNTNDSIPLSEMKDGQIGVITKWENCTQYIGRVVQRYGNDLIIVGMPKCYGWAFLFKADTGNRVRLLRNDEPLYVDNDDLGE
jgi:hypothetical protein